LTLSLNDPVITSPTLLLDKLRVATVL